MVSKKVREFKHLVFGLLPGRVGLRNRACLHHLKKPSLEAVFEAALAELQPGDICIDCGANTGSVTTRFMATGAEVFAFEPDPWSFARLRERIGTTNNVHLRNQAVGVHAGSLPFYRDAAFLERPDLHSLGSSLQPRPGAAHERIEVEVIDFPSFVAALDRPVAILKVDIEGAEVAILEQLFESCLIERCRHVFVETHELQFPDLLERTWALRKLAERSGRSIWLDWH